MRHVVLPTTKWRRKHGLPWPCVHLLIFEVKHASRREKLCWAPALDNEGMTNSKNKKERHCHGLAFQFLKMKASARPSVAMKRMLERSGWRLCRSHNSGNNGIVTAGPLFRRLWERSVLTKPGLRIIREKRAHCSFFIAPVALWLNKASPTNRVSLGPSQWRMDRKLWRSTTNGCEPRGPRSMSWLKQRKKKRYSSISKRFFFLFPCLPWPATCGKVRHVDVTVFSLRCESRRKLKGQSWSEVCQVDGTNTLTSTVLWSTRRR